MQSCSVHHCVLFLLTLTFTTDPGAAASVFPLHAKLHQSVTLPCATQCFPRKANWALDNNRDDVFAQCDQTSCTSVKQGYEMSFDQFKKGDLSLIITNPDYSLRKTYTCECGISEYITWNLRISTEFSAVPVQTEGDLKLDLSVPESVEVIYRGSVLSDDVQICTVTDRTLQCNTEYTPRTSLSNSELTLRNIQRSETGTFTIRNLDYKEDIRVYAVSVSGLTTGETAGIVIAVLMLLAGLTITGVMLYRKKEEVERRRGQFRSEKEAVNGLIGEAVFKPPVEMMEALQQVEEKMNALEQKYRDDRLYSILVRHFCNNKRKELETCRELFGPHLLPVTGEVKSAMLAVYEDINETLHSAAVEKEKLQRVVKKIKDLEQKYSTGDGEHSDSVRMFCKSKREYLRLYRDVFITRDTSLQPVTQEVKTVMNEVDDLIKEADLKPGGEQEEEMQEVLQKINDVELKYSWTEGYYRNVTWFCDTKRAVLNYCREVGVYETDKETEKLQIKEVEKEIDEVDDLIQKVLHPTPGEQEEEVLQKVEDKYNDLLQNYTKLNLLWVRQNKHRTSRGVEEKINDLEQKCREYSEYYHRVKWFWNQKRRDLELCSKLGLLQLGLDLSNTEKEMEEVVKMLNELKWRSDQNHTVSPELLDRIYTRVSSSLKWINKQCREQRDNLKKFKQQPSHGETDNKMIGDVETHLRGLELWCMDKKYDLHMYSRELKYRGKSSHADPQTSRSKGGEHIPLLQV